MSDFKLYSTNWRDGMLITQRHLTQQEQYLESLARWYSLGSLDNYGVARKGGTDDNPLVLNCLAGSGKLKATVVKCQAVTRSGHYVEIDESLGYAVKGEAPLEDGTFGVYLIVHQDKVEVGDPDPEESLPRQPYRARKYSLYIGDEPSAPEMDVLQIASLNVAGNEVGNAEDYFPPCVSVGAERRLAARSSDLRNKLENLASLASRAYQSIATGTFLSGEKSDLQNAFKETVFRVANHLSSTLDTYVVGRNAMHPIQMVIYYKRLFRVISTLLTLEPALRDYLNEKHFAKTRSIDIGKFVSTIDGFLLTDYDHTNIGGHLTVIETIMLELREVFGFLAQTKQEELGREALAVDTLTYAGKTYRVMPHAAHKVEQVGELSYLLMDIESPQAVSDIVILMTKDLFEVAEWTRMQVRLGLNDARGLGETDPVAVDTTEFGAKVALRPQDLLQTPQVNKVTLIFRGASDQSKFTDLGKLDLMAYAV